MKGVFWVFVLFISSFALETNAVANELPAVDSGWNYQDASASEANFRALIAQARDAEQQAYVAEAMTQLARSIGLQRRFDEAHAVLDEVETLLADDMSRARVRLALERGRVINSSGDPAGSIPYFESALSLAEASGYEYLAVDAAHMLGIVSEPDDAIRWNETAMRMAEAASDQRVRRWLGPLYNNLAWTYNDIGKHEEALALFERDLALRESQGQTFEASIALWSKAKTLRFLGRVDEALAIQESLVDHPERQGNPAEGYTHEEIGECLLLLGREAEAKAHFAIAYERLGNDPWLEANEPDRLARLRVLGGVGD
jgi:tetratricopeptide (TPR) repeat protein